MSLFLAISDDPLHRCAGSPFACVVVESAPFEYQQGHSNRSSLASCIGAQYLCLRIGSVHILLRCDRACLLHFLESQDQFSTRQVLKCLASGPYVRCSGRNLPRPLGLGDSAARRESLDVEAMGRSVLCPLALLHGDLVSDRSELASATRCLERRVAGTSNVAGSRPTMAFSRERRRGRTTARN